LAGRAGLVGRGPNRAGEMPVWDCSDFRDSLFWRSNRKTSLARPKVSRASFPDGLGTYHCFMMLGNLLTASPIIAFGLIHTVRMSPRLQAQTVSRYQVLETSRRICVFRLHLGQFTLDASNSLVIARTFPIISLREGQGWQQASSMDERQLYQESWTEAPTSKRVRGILLHLAVSLFLQCQY